MAILIIPNHGDRTIKMLPFDGLDDKGNPKYDFTELHTIIPADNSLLHLFPQKACPLPDEWNVCHVSRRPIPAFINRIKTNTGYGHPADVCWMGGWVYSKYDDKGNRLFTVAAFRFIAMEWIGSPTSAARRKPAWWSVATMASTTSTTRPMDCCWRSWPRPIRAGWLDNNGSVSINRNPKDGMIDFFAEESFRNRISWYRMDDRDQKELSVAIEKPAEAGAVYFDQAKFDDALAAVSEGQARRRD